MINEYFIAYYCSTLLYEITFYLKQKSLLILSIKFNLNKKLVISNTICVQL